MAETEETPQSERAARSDCGDSSVSATDASVA